ncbi:hypothetical protein B9T26_01740 [Acinetobacter sp. ANC 4169]|uniref:hypothetical protein n=1 Tax=Acinetobacter sp. ANC 4169 TaxID=1977879 RepID=UPI000A32FCB2|nr:hypothetical protein [Acinetobacter sp. ANC 4169]OTG76555.1 hypothetical protein B9T26_01740 [Acinetobacter sp. ANC 4169]
MANPKPTFLRIFQPEKKKSNSAVCYGILGFCAGIIFSAILGYSYLNSLDHQEIQSHSVSSNAYLSQQDVLGKKENEDDHPLEFPQPQESDLSQIFTHQTQLKSVAKHQNTMHSQVRSQQHSSHNKAVDKTIKKTEVPVSTPKPTLVNLPEISIKHAVKEVEANELPQASITISETKTPVIPPENAVSP